MVCFTNDVYVCDRKPCCTSKEEMNLPLVFHYNHSYIYICVCVIICVNVMYEGLYIYIYTAHRYSLEYGTTKWL